MRGSGIAVALGCVALVAGGTPAVADAATAGRTTTLPVAERGGHASNVHYALGAAWVQVGPRLLERVQPGRPTRRVRLAARIEDVTAGYGRVWVLTRRGDASWATALNARTARIVGPRKGTRLARGLTGIRAGAGAVWAGALGRLSRMDPRTRRVATHLWPTTETGATGYWFAVAGGSLWSFSDANLNQWGPSAVAAPGKRSWDFAQISETKGVGTQEGPLSAVYQGGGFYLIDGAYSNSPTVTRVTPGKGAVASAQLPTGCIDVPEMELGAGSPWILCEGFAGGRYTLVRASLDLQQVDAYQVPKLPRVPKSGFGGDVSMAFGGGALWFTTGGRKLVRIVPS